MTGKHAATLDGGTKSGGESLVARSARGVAGQGDWGWLVAIYLALSSAGAAAYAAWQVLRWLDPPAAAATRTGAGLGIGAVIAGSLFVLLDLGRWSRFYRAGARPRLSWESRAFFLIVAFVALGCVQIAAWLGGLAWDTLLAVPMSAAALGLLSYGAILLRGMRAYTLWSHPLQIALFPASALLAGCTMLALDPASVLPPVQSRQIAAVAAVLAVLEAALLAAVLHGTRAAGKAGAASVETLVSGARSRSFWAVAVAAGLLVPLLASAAVWAGAVDPRAMRVAAIAALAGLVSLRYEFLAAARRPSELTFRGSGPWGIAR